MRLHPWFRLALVASAVVSLAGCSYISSLFPDKQKQYRYSTELPDLEIPPDLGVAKLSKQSKDVESDKAVESAATPVKKRKTAKHKEAEATLAENAENAALIEVSEPFPEAWNDVSRALGRLKIEISDQNRSDKVFYVYYGGEAPKKAEDASIFGRLGAVFGFEGEKAKEYRVKLEDKEDYTLVRVYDPDDKVVSEGYGLELLKRLHKKLITLNQPEPEEGKRAEEAEKAKSAADKQ